MNWLNDLLYPVSFRPIRRLGTITRYMTVEENGTDELEIADHPVQEGTEITDNAYKKSAQLTVRIQFNEADTGTPLDETYRAMLELQNSRTPFEVVTGKRVYQNMLFKSLGCTTDKFTDNVLVINAELREIIVTNVAIVNVPPRSKQATPGRTSATENAGQKKAETVTKSPEKKKSALKSISGSF